LVSGRTDVEVIVSVTIINVSRRTELISQARRPTLIDVRGEPFNQAEAHMDEEAQQNATALTQ
jgi:hypothetical protein